MTSTYDKLTFLYTNIGRGHPYYLDGIMEELINSGKVSLVKRHTDVFEESHGIAALGWKAVRKAYKIGSQDNILSNFYNNLRKGNDFNRQSKLFDILGKDILEAFDITSDTILVAHPILVKILSGFKTIYQHGELVAPDESLVHGADKVLVPTEELADKFINFGYDINDIFVSGLCVEPSLVRNGKEYLNNRYNRLTSREPATAAIFSSGAEPAKHRKKIRFILRDWLANNQRAIVFASENGKLKRDLIEDLESYKRPYQLVDNSEAIPHEIENVLIVSYQTRRGLNIFTERLFHKFDILISPSHERTNWSLGLGLPMFILDPPIGSFAPLNRELLINSNTGIPIKTDSESLGFFHIFLELRKNGMLVNMMENGWEKRDINGFKNIGNFLKSYLNMV